MSIFAAVRRSVAFASTVVMISATVLLQAGPVSAAAFRIVALGASNTNGRGVGSAEAFPAQIDAMLRAKGIDARVSVSATNGETSAQLLARVDSSVPNGTTLVLIEPVRANDHRVGVSDGQNLANLAAIRSRLARRKIKSIVVQLRPLPADGLQPDGIHLTAHGHRAIAARYLPQVITALKSAR